MADNRKEQERAELHRVIWNIANDLRGSVDGWDFKQYVLGMLFYRYIAENLTAYLNARMAEVGHEHFDYANMPDAEAEAAREEMVKTKGFFILPSELFVNVCRNAAHDDNLNETLEQAFRHIEQSAAGWESEDNFRGLFDDMDVNSKKLGEVDFVVSDKNDRVLPLEVKSGKGYSRHRALSKVLDVPNYHLDRGYVLGPRNVSVEGKVAYLPIYMVSQFKND